MENTKQLVKSLRDRSSYLRQQAVETYSQNNQYRIIVQADGFDDYADEIEVNSCPCACHLEEINRLSLFSDQRMVCCSTSQ